MSKAYVGQKMPIVKGKVFFKGEHNLESNVSVIVEGKAPEYKEFEAVVRQIRNSSMSFACSAPHSSADKAVELFKAIGHDVRKHQDTYAFKLGKLYHYCGD